MPVLGDNPFDDGLDFVGCPPQPTDLKLPHFPESFGEDCKLIRWGRCSSVPDGERRMVVKIFDFRPDPDLCGVYGGQVLFVDAVTGAEWYTGTLKFYYTRNYIYTGTSIEGEAQRSIAFRFVAKGDIERVSDRMPERQCLILCTKRKEAEEAGVRSYEEIFVYGGLDILCDIENYEMNDFMLGLGHNDGWYTHHPKCSARPIDWSGHGDYIGHYCDRGWLFVSPGRNFVFDPAVRPPTGRFFEEALRRIDGQCHTEEAIRYGAFDPRHIRCIHSYQELKGITECRTFVESAESCQGLVYSGERHPWITFFSMGYWMDRYQKVEQILHLAEGNIRLSNEYEEYKEELYFYGFATQNDRAELKLVDFASNKSTIGMPAYAERVLYLYNAGTVLGWNPKVRIIVPVDPELSARLVRREITTTRDKAICPFLKEPDEQESAS